jgi:hypothetical protein
MKEVIACMARFPDSLKIQRACCHTISNVCMDVDFARRIVLEYNCHLLVVKAIEKFYLQDWKLCWLACSAIWNMTRSDEVRSAFGLHVAGVDLLLNVLKTNDHKHCVVNTVMGCLSNLSFNYKFKIRVGEPQNVLNLLDVMERNLDEINVAATSAGLLANLAVDDKLADLLVDYGAIGTVNRMLSRDFDDVILLRNTLAAMSNFATSPVFLEEFIRHDVITTMISARRRLNNIGLDGLMENSLHAVGVDFETMFTTSYHLASFHGLVRLFHEMVSNEIDEIDFNMIDGTNRSLISYALDMNHVDMVSYLICCGAQIGKHPFNQNTGFVMLRAIAFNIQFTKEVRKESIDLLKQCTPYNVDICYTINTFLSAYSLFCGKNLLKICF